MWFVLFKIFVPCRSGPPVDGPKDPWPRVLSLPGRFVGDPASLARDNHHHIHIVLLSLTLFFLRFRFDLDDILHKGGSWDPDNRKNTEVWLP